MSESATYVDSDEFKEYVKAISALLNASPIVTLTPYPVRQGMTIGEIHRGLGDAKRPEWTMDAIPWVDNVVTVEGYLTRYRIEEKPPVNYKGAKFTDSLFPKGKNSEKEKQRRAAWVQLRGIRVQRRRRGRSL